MDRQIEFILQGGQLKIISTQLLTVLTSGGILCLVL